MHLIIQPRVYPSYVIRDSRLLDSTFNHLAIELHIEYLFALKKFIQKVRPRSLLTIKRLLWNIRLVEIFQKLHLASLAYNHLHVT